MKKLVAIILATLLILTAAALAEEKPVLTLANLTEIMDENETALANYIQKAIDKYNSDPNSKYDIEDLIMYDALSSVDTMNSQLETLPTAGVDVAFLTVVDKMGNITGCDYAGSHGVKLIEMRGVPSDYISCYFTLFDSRLEVKMLHAWWVEKLEADPDLKLNIAVIHPTPESTSAAVGIRTTWVPQLVEEYPDRVKIVVEGYGNWTTTDAQQLAEDWLQVYGNEINYFLCANDEEALGVVNALDAAGRLDEFYITGYNGGTTGTDLLLRDKITATIGQMKSVGAEIYLQVAIDTYEDKIASQLGEDGWWVAPDDVEFLRVLTHDNIVDWVHGDYAPLQLDFSQYDPALGL